MTVKQIIAAALILLLLPNLASARAPADNLAAVLEQARAGKSVPGMGVAEIRNGRLVGLSVVGIRRMGQPDPVTPNDRWLLGSDTKAMTATMVARLVDKGVLSWSSRLDQVFPELATEMRPEYRDITLLDLLSHRSGLPTDIDDMPFLLTFVGKTDGLRDRRLAYIRRALTDAPVGPSRDKASYSNSGYVVAAAIAERATGKPYEVLMEENVFRPLGMRSAGFTASPKGPVGHVDGRPALEPLDPNPPVFNSSNGVQLTLQDWAKFCIDQMNGYRGHGRLLRPQTYRVVMTAQGATNQALGWVAQPTVFGRGPALYHTGSDGNWFADAILYPMTGDAVLVVANSAYSMSGDKAAEEAGRAVVERFPAAATR